MCSLVFKSKEIFVVAITYEGACVKLSHLVIEVFVDRDQP